MIQLILVGVGGFLGSVLRFLVSAAAVQLAGERFPLGTLAVNLAGCLLVGFLGTWLLALGAAGETQRRFWVAGFLGGFTTFSAFGFEIVQLGSDGRPGAGALYAAVQVAGGVALVWLGRAVALAWVVPR